MFPLKHCYFAPRIKCGRKNHPLNAIVFSRLLANYPAEYADRMILNFFSNHQVVANLLYNVTEIVRFLKNVQHFFSKKLGFLEKKFSCKIGRGEKYVAEFVYNIIS